MAIGARGMFPPLPLCAPYVPHRSALLRRLAEQKAHLLEGLCECVSARHGGRGGIVVNDVRKMGKQTAPQLFGWWSFSATLWLATDNKVGVLC